jgi:sporulation protein YlmC with PRC-barrel domain
VTTGSRSASSGRGRGRARTRPHWNLGSELLHLPVRVRGTELGRPTDLLLDLDRLRVVGLHVRCDKGVQRFLPLAAAVLSSDEISAPSSLSLLDESAYYSEHSASLRSLRGSAVDVAGRPAGTLADIVFHANGEVIRVVVKGESGKLRRLRADHVRIRQAKGNGK